MSDAKPARGTVATVLGITGLVLYAAVGYVYVVSGLVVPVPWLFFLWTIWLAGIWPLIWVFRNRRPWAPLVAVSALAVWGLYVSLGGALFDWTA